MHEELLNKDNKLIAENLKVGYKGLVEFYDTNPSILRTLEENPIVFWREFEKFVIDDLYYLITDTALPNYVKVKWLIYNCESFGLEVPTDIIKEVHNIETTEDNVTDLENTDGMIDRLYVLLEDKLVAYIRNL